MRARLNDDRSDALRRGKSQPRRIRAIRNDGLDARRPLFLRAGAHQRLHIAAASAQNATSASQSGLMSFLPLIAMFAVLYFIMIRPQMKRHKEHRTMLSA